MMRHVIPVLTFALLAMAARAQTSGWWDLGAKLDPKAALESLATSRLGLPVTIGSASGLTGSALLSDVKIADGSGRVLVAAGQASVKSYAPLTLAVERLTIALTPGARVEVPAGELEVAGDGVMVLRAPAASLTAPAPLTVAELDARIVSTPAGPRIDRFSAKVFGGRASGSVTPAASGPPQVDLELRGIAISAVTGRPGREKLDATFRGPLPDKLRDLSGTGRATLSHLSTDLSHDPTLRSMQAQAARGARAGELLNFIGDDLIRGLAGSMLGSGQAAHYRSVISSLRRWHNLGSAGGPLKVSRGVATIAPFSGSRVAGKLTANLVTRALGGHLSRVQLGRVRLLSVSIGGTMAKPSYNANKNRVLVDGRPVSAKRSGPNLNNLPRAFLGRALGAPQPRDVLRGLLGGLR